MLAVLCLAGVAGAAPLGAAPLPTAIAVGDAHIRIDRRGPPPDLGDSELLAWIRRSADIVARYYGYFPVKDLALHVITVDGSAVRNGHANTMPSVRIDVTVGAAVSHQELQSDWVLVHEMIHFALPRMDDDHNWLAEGVATYVEGVARVQAGNMSAAELWGEYVAQMPRGVSAPGDRGLDHTHSWASTYWGGALFCLLADVKIREATHNGAGLRDALRAIGRGGGMTVNEDIDRALAEGDPATGTTALEDLYAAVKGAPLQPDLDALWRDLGIRVGNELTFDDTAPLAAERRAITAP